MSSFEEINIGDTAEISHQITESDLEKFCDLTGDVNPLHMDSDYAESTTYKKRVAHGMLTASFLSTIIGTKLPGKGALWLSQTIQFLLPVRIGDTLKVIAKVKHKSKSNYIIVLDTIIYNQNGQKVLEGEARIKILKKNEENMKKSKNEKGGAIITGASRGIGAATALELATNGYQVIINYKDSRKEAESVLNQILESGGKGYLYKTDVKNYDDVEKMVQFAKNKFGRIDAVINNATNKIISQTFEQIKWEDIQEHLDVQIKGVFNTCKAVIPIMISQKTGKIINIGSISSDNVPPLKWYSYVIAKSALASFTKSLAHEYGPKGLNINCVSPGMTETALIADIPEKVKLVTEMQIPLRRLAKPQDIANVIAFLVSDAASYLTGETIRVCGGHIMI